MTSWADNQLESSVLHRGDQCTKLDVYKAKIPQDIDKAMSSYVSSCLTFDLVVQNKNSNGITVTVTAGTCTCTDQGYQTVSALKIFTVSFLCLGEFGPN